MKTNTQHTIIALLIIILSGCSSGNNGVQSSAGSLLPAPTEPQLPVTPGQPTLPDSGSKSPIASPTTDISPTPSSPIFSSPDQTSPIVSSPSDTLTETDETVGETIEVVSNPPMTPAVPEISVPDIYVPEIDADEVIATPDLQITAPSESETVPTLVEIAPVTGEVDTVELDTVVPVVTEPIITEPIVAAPVASEPVTTVPVITAPIVSAPIVSAPIVTAPIVTAPTSEVAVTCAAQSSRVSNLELKTGNGRDRVRGSCTIGQLVYVKIQSLTASETYAVACKNGRFQVLLETPAKKNDSSVSFCAAE